MKSLAWCLVGFALSGGPFSAQISRSPLPENLYALQRDTGQIFVLGTIDGARRLVANIGLAGVGSLELAPDGFLYATGTRTNAGLYRIDPTDGSSTYIGQIANGFIFEGGLAFSPGGTAWAVNSGSANKSYLFTVDLVTGAGSNVGAMGAHDINGLAWRSDGVLVGLDRITNSLVEIDPTTARTTVLAPLTPLVGGLGGMTISGLGGYFTTGGPGTTLPGSHELWSFDPFTGAASLLFELPEQLTGSGLSGLSTMAFASSASVGSGVRLGLVAPASPHALTLLLQMPPPLSRRSLVPSALAVAYLDGRGRTAFELPPVLLSSGLEPWAAFAVLDPQLGTLQLSRSVPLVAGKRCTGERLP